MKRIRTPDVISGRVAADGTLAVGKNFSCRRLSLGTYEVSLPDVSGGWILTPGPGDSSSSTVYVVEPIPISANKVQIVIRQPGVALKDLPFTFIAVQVGG